MQKGEIFGLLGRNGAGKTTAIRVLAGYIDLRSGQVTVAGCDVVKDQQKLTERIGAVFEEQNLYERLPAANNPHFNCWLFDLPVSRIQEVFDQVHRTERSRKPLRTSSKG